MLLAEPKSPSAAPKTDIRPKPRPVCPTPPPSRRHAESFGPKRLSRHIFDPDWFDRLMGIFALVTYRC